MRVVDGREEVDEEEAKRRNALLRKTWGDFERWRVGRRKELKERGEKLEPIYTTDKSTGTITVQRKSLLRQFADFLVWVIGQRETEKLRRKVEEQQKVLAEEYERAKNGRDYGDD